MPFAGMRSRNASVYYQGSYGYYWSSSPNDSDSASNLELLSSSVDADGDNFRANADSVRCFKDSFELPTSSWTVIKGTL